MPDKQRYKVQFDVPLALRDQLDEFLPWGARRVVYTAITEQMVALAERVGKGRALGLLLTASVDILELLKVKKENLNGGPGNIKAEHLRYDGGGDSRSPGRSSGES